MGDAQVSRRLLSRLRALTVELDLLGAGFARQHGLHPTDVRALIALVEAERAGQVLSPGRLARLLELDASSVTALVDRLQRMGHVHRTSDPVDRRRVQIRLQEQATELGLSFFSPLIGDATRALQDFDDAELATVDRFLQVMTDLVTTARHQPHEDPPSRSRPSR